MRSWASVFHLAGWHTASISSFPLDMVRWWNSGFMESMNLMRGFGGERADQVFQCFGLVERREKQMTGFCMFIFGTLIPHIGHLKIMETFESDPVPSWHTEDVRMANWDLSGPHSAQEPWGFRPDEWGEPPPRQPWNASSMDAVKQILMGMTSVFAMQMMLLGYYLINSPI